ncbi:thioredoxin [Actinokineospora spheciospongiae]|uniref:thioredoxin n=1 Tax=Actinokineospora spheciospongiae TaxID=909613 RepID=UPI000D7101E4|nr:thioredoxin [Actinokineospora spheciospongiae]PWW52284.1 thioredoxin [Actinokineospora spheciospongiae]
MITANAVTAVTDSTFAEEVLHRDGPVLVEFWAQWCGPCHMMAPVLAEIAATRPDLTIRKINADENPTTARDHRVMSLPTLLLFAGGEPVRAIVGARPKARLLAEVDAALADLS